MAEKNKGGAPKGSKNHEKFKTPAERQKAYVAYCSHIGKGYTKKSFYDPSTHRTIEKMLADYPAEFDIEKMDIAESKSAFFWENMGLDGARGKLPNFNSGTWIFNMKNRLGWKDSQEIGFKDGTAVFVLKMGKELKTEKE